MLQRSRRDTALRAGAERFANLDVHLDTEIEAVEQIADDITLTVRSAGADAVRAVSGSWLLGCDGARSLVRRAAAIDHDDLGLGQPWLVVDTLLRGDVPLPELTLQICDPRRPTTYVPSAGDHRRWEFMLLPGEDANAMEPAETVHSLLSAHVDPGAVEVIRAAVYTFHALIAERWRWERAFLVGDSAHQMPPFLGQGMCSGIRDAANLAWKLAGVVHGRYPESLLDSYQLEREPHVREIIGRAVKAGSVIQTLDPELAAARNEHFRSQPEGVRSASIDGEQAARLPSLTGGMSTAPASTAVAGGLLPQPMVSASGHSEQRLDALLGSRWAVVRSAGPGGLVVEGVPWEPRETLPAPGARRDLAVSLARTQRRGHRARPPRPLHLRARGPPRPGLLRGAPRRRGPLRRRRARRALSEGPCENGFPPTR